MLNKLLELTLATTNEIIKQLNDIQVKDSTYAIMKGYWEGYATVFNDNMYMLNNENIPLDIVTRLNLPLEDTPLKTLLIYNI